MAVSLGSNLYSLRAISSINKTSREVSKVFEQLSSGMRINSAADDPAGLAVASNLRADARIAQVAMRNTNDGISAIAIADGALESVSSLLFRMQELAEQSANGTYSAEQRSALSLEFSAIGSEIERIASSTEFNGVALLSNSSNMTIQVGLDNGAESKITIQSVLGTVAALGIGAASGALSISITDATAAGSALTSLDLALNSLNLFRGKLGASEARLNTAVTNLDVMKTNFLAAESQIMDIDVAEATANMVRLQILQQAGAAVLAQANQQPGIVLQLIA